MIKWCNKIYWISNKIVFNIEQINNFETIEVINIISPSGGFDTYDIITTYTNYKYVCFTYR